MVANNNNNNNNSSSNNKKNNAAIKSSSSPHNNNNHHNNNNNKGNINKSPKSPSGRDSVLHSKSQQNFQYSNNRRSPKHQKTGNSNAAPQSKYPRKAIDKFNDQTFSEAPEEPLGNFIGGSFVEAGSSHQSANNRIELSRPHLSTSTPTSISIRDFKDGYFVTRPTSSSPPNSSSSSSSSSLSASSSAESSKEKVESVFVTPAKLKDNNLPLPLLSEAPTPSSVRNVQNFILSATSLPPSSSFSTSSSSSSSSSSPSSSSSANSSFDSLVSTSLPNLSIIESTSTPPSIIITGKQQLNHSPPRSTSPLSSSFLLTTPPPISSSSPSSPTIITHRKVRSRSDIKSSPSSAFAHYANPPPPTHIPIPSFS